MIVLRLHFKRICFIRYSSRTAVLLYLAPYDITLIHLVKQQGYRNLKQACCFLSVLLRSFELSSLQTLEMHVFPYFFNGQIVW
jgi:hypothetical protein